ncbi:alcohol dehydrogenase [Fusarium albosuccineum]|uniref:Alcohol dehydrogenase n=1 Tax=Fusarium albosuccineum TaxID=1237068 RepID=A0A8H4LLG7_9HYPO|nr:alcohol dehydrogenase [Fusarium albosuccineum]
MSIPRTTKAWTVEGRGSFDCLKFDKERVLPELSDNDVLVKFYAASLNYHDIIIALGHYPFLTTPDVIPGSDGAGEVVAVGSKVTRFEKAKAEILKNVGVDYVINYKETPNWGEEAKRLMGGAGVEYVIEVGGATTMTESLKAVAIGGIVTIIGWVGGEGETGLGFP